MLLDKPTGMTSNDALQKARRLYSAEKGGHTGTLDPMASGLLPVCFGEATKFGSDLLDADKTYLATLRLGERSNTGDADGEIVERRPVTVDDATVREALAALLGPQMQTPPMHSALKRNGVPLYRLAREGIEVEREPRAIRIDAIAAVRIALPELVIRVACSKGTYIRVLAEDIGEALNCGAHLTALRRERVAALSIDEALSLDALSALDDAARLAVLRPVDFLLQELPRIEIDEAALQRFGNGNPICVKPGELDQGDRFRVYSGGRLIGLGRRDDEGHLQPQRLLRRDPT
ncbi:MAG TPA: tRNA pseudouridine(55) synthase TruB [Rhodocyclaceae bacterium]